MEAPARRQVPWERSRTQGGCCHEKIRRRNWTCCSRYVRALISEGNREFWIRKDREADRDISIGKQFGVTRARWPVKSAEFLLGLLKNAEANADTKGLDTGNLIVKHIQVNQAPKQRRRTYRAHGRVSSHGKPTIHPILIFNRSTHTCQILATSNWSWPKERKLFKSPRPLLDVRPHTCPQDNVVLVSVKLSLLHRCSLFMVGWGLREWALIWRSSYKVISKNGWLVQVTYCCTINEPLNEILAENLIASWRIFLTLATGACDIFAICSRALPSQAQSYGSRRNLKLQVRSDAIHYMRISILFHETWA